MKRKEILSKIKNQALNEMPDVFNRINLENIEIQDNNFNSIKKPLNFRRAFSYTFASLFILVSGFMIYNFGYLSLINDSNPLESETEMIGFQTVSAAALLSIADVSELNYFDNDYVVTELNQSTSTVEDEIELINSYLNLAETVIGNESNFVYNNIESDNQNYLYAFEYKGSDLAGNLIVYKVYYNKETALNGNEITSGILIHGFEEYNFTSSQIQKDDKIINKYKIYIDSDNFVEVSDVSNNNLQKFSYQVFKDGNLSNSSEITINSYKNNIKATMNITNNYSDQLTLEFERNTEDFDNQEMKIKYTYSKGNNLETGEISVNLIQDDQSGSYQYQYQFGNDEVIVTDRSGKGNTKASEDDFKPVKGNKDSNSTSTVSTEEETTTDNQTSSNPGNSNGTSGNPNSSNNKATQDNYQIEKQNDIEKMEI
jgi:hypothetical protein